MDHLLFSLVVMIWGSAFLLMKKASLAWGPVGVSAWRVGAGALVLWAIWAMRRRPLELGRSQAGHLALVTLLGFVVAPLAMALLIGRFGQSAFFGMMLSLVPLVTLVLSVPMLGQRPSARQAAGVLGGLALLCLLSLDAQGRSVPIWALGVALLVPVCGAATNVLIKRRLSDVPALSVAAPAMAAAGIALSVAAVLLEGAPRAQHLPISTGAAATLGISQGLGIFCAFSLIQRRGPLFMGMATYVIPLVALAWGWFDGEALTALQLAVLAGVLGCVALVQGDRRPVVQPA